MSTYAVLLFMKLTKSDNCLPANGPLRVSDVISSSTDRILPKRRGALKGLYKVTITVSFFSPSYQYGYALL